MVSMCLVCGRYVLGMWLVQYVVGKGGKFVVGKPDQFFHYYPISQLLYEVDVPSINPFTPESDHVKIPCSLTRNMTSHSTENLLR